MLVDDIVKTRFIYNVDGVNCNNTMFWKVLAVPATDTLSVSLLKVATAWWNAVKVLLSPNVVLLCADWDNQTQNENAIVYPAIAGGPGGEAHPAIAYLNIHVEGWDGAAAVPRTVSKTSIKLSGILKSITKDGRLNDTANTTAWEAFMINTLLVDVGELNVQPMCRHDSAGKAWRAAGSIPPQPAPVYEYYASKTSVVRDQVRTISGRKGANC